MIKSAFLFTILKSELYIFKSAFQINVVKHNLFLKYIYYSIINFLIMKQFIKVNTYEGSIY